MLPRLLTRVRTKELRQSAGGARWPVDGRFQTQGRNWAANQGKQLNRRGCVSYEKHQEKGRPSKPSRENSSVPRVPSDKRRVCSEFRSATAAPKDGECEE